MSIKDKLDTLLSIKDNMFQVITDKGVSIPANTPFENYPDKVNAISGGGGGSGSYVFNPVIDKTQGVSTLNLQSPLMLPDYTMYEGDYNYCLMPVVNTKGNPYLINNGCTIEDGVASDFSSSQYLTINRYLNVENKTWSLTAAFTTSDNVLPEQHIYFLNPRHSRYGICFYVSDHNLCINIGNGNDWVIREANGGRGSYIVEPNTTYWTRFGYNGTSYYVDYSLDGVAWNNDISLQQDTIMIPTLLDCFIGIYTSSYPFLGTIDLRYCSISVNGNVWWAYPQNDRMYKNVIVKGPFAPNLINNGCSRDGSIYTFKNSWVKLDNGFNPTGAWHVDLEATNPEDTYCSGMLFQTCKQTEAGDESKRYGIYLRCDGTSGFNFSVADDNDWFVDVNTKPLVDYDKGNSFSITFGYNGTEYYLIQHLKEVDVDLYREANNKKLHTNNVAAFIGVYATGDWSTWFNGKMDLSKFKIWNGNTLWWEYNDYGSGTIDAPGCLMYEDDGNACSVDAYCINRNQIVLSKTAPSIVGANVQKLGTVNVPAHDLYSYSVDGTWTKITD